MDNPKNETCKALETSFEVIANRGEDEIMEEDLIEEEEVGTEKGESKNHSDQTKKGVTIEQLMDENSPWRRTKKQTLNNPNLDLPDYIKLSYPIIKKKPLQEDEAWLFARFKEMLAKLQVSIYFHEVLELMPKFSKFMKALLNCTKKKLDKELVNITEKCNTAGPETMPPKLKDLGKFTISCAIGGVKIPRALCDLGSSVNVMLFDKA